jgi:hypothetical protein
MKISKTHHVTKKGTVKKNPKKDDMFLLRKMLKFEGSAQDYMDSQIEGIILESGKTPEYRHQYYIDEKVNNIIRFFDNAMDNFVIRMMNPTIRKEWDEFKMPTKVSDTKLLKKAFEFEYLNAGWIDDNIRGIELATDPKRGWVDTSYVAEKVASAKRHMRAIQNFATRMNSTTAPELRGVYMKSIGRK